MKHNPSHKQAFLFTAINYIGIIIGVISTLFIYPKNKEILGTIRFVEALSQVLYPIMVLGASQALVNFYPNLDQKNQKLLFNYSLVSILISASFVALVLLGIGILDDTNVAYLYYAFPIGLSLAFVELFKKQATIIQKIAVPTFFDNIIPKISLPIIFLLVLFQYINTEESLYLYIISYGMIAFLCGIYLLKNNPMDWNFKFNTLFEKISKSTYYKYSLFAFAGSLGSLFAFRIDALMIPKFISMSALGSFSIGVTLASALAIPATGIFILYAPIISNLLKTNQLDILNSKYKEVAKLLFFIGGILYSCVFLGISDLFSLLPTHDSLTDSINVILILGLNVLINMATGFNSEIITYSPYFRFNLVAILILIGLNIGLNLHFITQFHWGIEGVAIASLMSMGLFNLSKLVFIYKKFKLFPFNFSTLKLLFVLSTTLCFCALIPKTNSEIANLFIKCSLNLSLNLFLIYRLKLVFQWNSWCNTVLNKVRRALRF